MPNHPTGTVTFLFTDIEGSTRLIQDLGDVLAVEVFEGHRRVLRNAVAAGGGRELQDQGDGFLFVFPLTQDGMLAAIAAQRALQTHPCPPGRACASGLPFIPENPCRPRKAMSV